MPINIYEDDEDDYLETLMEDIDESDVFDDLKTPEKLTLPDRQHIETDNDDDDDSSNFRRFKLSRPQPPSKPDADSQDDHAPEEAPESMPPQETGTGRIETLEVDDASSEQKLSGFLAKAADRMDAAQVRWAEGKLSELEGVDFDNIQPAKLLATTFNDFSTKVRVVEDDETARNTNRDKRIKVSDPSASWREIKKLSGSRLSDWELDFYRRLGITKQESAVNPAALFSIRPALEGNRQHVSRRINETMASAYFSTDAVYSKNKAKRLTNADYLTLRFLATMKYATENHIAKLTNGTAAGARKRLQKLQYIGMVQEKDIFGNAPIWFLTNSGMIVSGYELPLLNESKLSYNMFPHQFVVNHLAACLTGANINVLNDPQYPRMNQTNRNGSKKLYGEQIVSELEIRCAVGREGIMEYGEELNPRMRKLIGREFTLWDEKRKQTLQEVKESYESGDRTRSTFDSEDEWRTAYQESLQEASSMLSPEQEIGNEFMWALWPRRTLGTTWHFPDLVVRRPRDNKGRPQSVAIEVELNNKLTNSYERTLTAYKEDNLIYGQVVWIVKSRYLANKLHGLAQEIGLKKISILPIITENGVFKGRDTWLL